MSSSSSYFVPLDDPANSFEDRKRVLLQEAKGLASLIACRLCQKISDSSIILPCLHTFCYDCFDNHVSSSSSTSSTSSTSSSSSSSSSSSNPEEIPDHPLKGKRQRETESDDELLPQAKMIKPREGAGEVYALCPTCGFGFNNKLRHKLSFQTNILVPSFNRQFVEICNALDRLKGRSPPLPDSELCTVCPELQMKATFKCQCCEILFCDKHVHEHLIKLGEDRPSDYIGQPYQDYKPENFLGCKIHPGQLSNRICITCGLARCFTCNAEHNRSHSMGSSSSVRSIQRSILSSVDNMRREIAPGEEKQRHLLQLLQEIEDNTETQRKLAHRFFSGLLLFSKECFVPQIEKSRVSLMEVLDHQSSQSKKATTEAIQRISNMIDYFDTQMLTIAAVIERSSIEQFCFLYSKINPRIMHVRWKAKQSFLAETTSEKELKKKTNLVKLLVEGLELKPDNPFDFIQAIESLPLALNSISFDSSSSSQDVFTPFPSSLVPKDVQPHQSSRINQLDHHQQQSLRSEVSMEDQAQNQSKKEAQTINLTQDHNNHPHQTPEEDQQSTPQRPSPPSPQMSTSSPDSFIRSPSFVKSH